MDLNASSVHEFHTAFCELNGVAWLKCVFFQNRHRNGTMGKWWRKQQQQGQQKKKKWIKNQQNIYYPLKNTTMRIGERCNNGL